MPRTTRSRCQNAEKKLIFHLRPDDGDAPDVTIFDKDDSVVYLDYPGYENYGKERKREISDSMRSRKKVMEDEGYIAGGGADEPLSFFLDVAFSRRRRARGADVPPRTPSFWLAV